MLLLLAFVTKRRNIFGCTKTAAAQQMVVNCCGFLCSSGVEEVAMSYKHLNCQVEMSKKRKVCEMFFSLRDLRAKVVVTHPFMGIQMQEY